MGEFIAGLSRVLDQGATIEDFESFLAQIKEIQQVDDKAEPIAILPKKETQDG